jgi:hypothetical protein
MANTYTLIASSTVGAGGATNVTFSSIPQTYTDLLICLSARDNIAAGIHNLSLQFNGSGSGYSGKFLYGNGSAAASEPSGRSDFLQGTFANGTTSTSNTFTNFQVYIPNYTSSNYKSVSIDGVQENNGTAGNDFMSASIWSNTAAITSIAWDEIDSGTLSQYSSFYLYGIKNS